MSDLKTEIIIVEVVAPRTVVNWNDLSLKRRPYLILTHRNRLYHNDHLMDETQNYDHEPQLQTHIGH